MSSDRESRLNAVRNAIAITEREGGRATARRRAPGNCCRPTSTGHITGQEMREAIMEHARRPKKESE
jgi:hypothetical protein